MGDYAFKFNFFLSAFFFNSFHFLVFVILLSLLRGLMWEVFIVIDNIIKPEYTKFQKFNMFFTKVTNNIEDKGPSDDCKKVTLIKEGERQQIILSPKYEKNSQLSNSNNLPIIEERWDEGSKNKSTPGKFEFERNQTSLGLNKNSENINEESFEDPEGKNKLLSNIYVYNDTVEPFAFHKKDEGSEEINIRQTIEKEQIKQETKYNEREWVGDEKEIELIHRKIQENLNQTDTLNSGTLQVKTETKKMSENQKSWINFYKQKIKQLKYFIHLQEKNKQKNQSKERKFDENADFFDGKDQDSMKVLEEFLINNLEDEGVADNFLPEKNNYPLETLKTMKSEKSVEKKKKTQGVNYGNSKEFLLKKAFLKDFNMEQIQVKKDKLFLLKMH